MIAHSPVFARALAAFPAPDGEARRWIYVPYDQLSDAMGPLSREAPETLGIVLVESEWFLRRRPYHRQKLALILANQRHFALEQAARRVAVRYVQTDLPHREALGLLLAELGVLECMEPAERELRMELDPLVKAGHIAIIPHGGWLTTPQQFLKAVGGSGPYRMDAFYRVVRQDSGYLMEDGAPVGGRYSMDGENRDPWRGTPHAPEPPHFTPDAVTCEVGTEIAARFAEHPGVLDPGMLPATAADAESLWAWSKAECLHHFGQFEDAMSTRSPGIFHTRIAALMNVHRLLPKRVVEDALALDIPLNSKEGFLRQVIGWREFVRHVHEATDGFRALEDGTVAPTPGDGGWSRWSGRAWTPVGGMSGQDGGSVASHLGAQNPLPQAYWGAASGMACLDQVVGDVWREGYSHHITRLMVLSNIATLLDVSPRELTDWFWVAYADAWDWVVEPNVMGMGTHGVGEVMSTKPYVAGAAYINKMSDYCAGCRFDPVGNCPIRRLYWAFLARHEKQLCTNPRLFMPMNSVRKRSESDRALDVVVFEKVKHQLGLGKELAWGILLKRRK